MRLITNSARVISTFTTTPVPAAISTPTTTVAQNLIVDSLAYWTNTMGIDGFRFDLAPVLGNNCLNGSYEASCAKLPRTVDSTSMRRTPTSLSTAS
jgi:pullulanase/glycogen debranching enzyme